MPRLVNCIKNCFYSTLLVGFIVAISSLFVWQAEIYQSTIDEQIRSMKLDLSAMKKENHLMEIKLNEQFGKHEDLKEEFRYLVKQAKWSALGVEDKKIENIKEETNKRDERQVDIQNRRVMLVKDGEVVEAPDLEPHNPLNINDAVNKALNDVVNDAGHEEIDLSKKTHIIVVSEKRGGSEVVAGLFDHDDSVFYLPGLSAVVKTTTDFNNLAHCHINEKIIQFYKTHLSTALSSKSLAQFCDEGKCENLTADSVKDACMRKHITVLQGTTDDLSLETLDKLEMEIVYVSRDPRAIVGEMLENQQLTEEEIQTYSTQLCTRINNYRSHRTSSHNVYEVIKYEKVASSPLTSLSTLYHKLLDTTHIPEIPMSKDTKNKLYLSVGAWKQQLNQIHLDAVDEECKEIIAPETQ